MNGQKVNYQKELEKVLEKLGEENRVPSLLLHSCCAPCSSYVLEYLSQYFHITVFYYNPNIYPESEYGKRIREQQELISKMDLKNPVSFLAGEYEQEKFYEMAEGMEHLREGRRALHENVMSCVWLRLPGELRRGGFDYFTTTLSISPLKNAQKLNEIGVRIGREAGVEYLVSDFKRRTATRDLWSCLKNTGCIDRITADVSFHWQKDGHSPQPKAPDHGVNRNAPGDLYPVHSDIFEAVCSLE